MIYTLMNNYTTTSLPVKDDPLPNIRVNNNSFDPACVEKVDIEEISGSFILKNILTEEECNEIISKIYNNGKAPSDSVPVLFRGWSDNPEDEYKKLATKKFYKSEEFASLLFERIKHFVPQDLVTNRSEKWNVHGLTKRHRFLFYENGQSFPPHTDAPFIVSNDNISHFTVLFYLNNCNESGELKFMKQTSGEWESIHTIQPEAGMVLVFPHNTIHTSIEMKPNQYKYLLRNDLLYIKVK